MSDLSDETSGPIAVACERAPTSHRVDRDRAQEFPELAGATDVESAAGSSGEAGDLVKATGRDGVVPFMKQERGNSLES